MVVDSFAPFYVLFSMFFIKRVVSVFVILSRVPVATGRLDKKTSSFTKSARCDPIRLLMIPFNSSNSLLEFYFHAYYLIGLQRVDGLKFSKFDSLALT